MMLLESFLIVAAAVVFFTLGRAYEERRCAADLRKLGRHLDREIAEHREALRSIPK